MAAVLSNVAVAPNNRPPSQSSSATSPPPPTKSFRQMVRASLQETLRTATRSKARDKGSVSIPNETGLASTFSASTTGPSDGKRKDKDKTIGKGKEKEKEPTIRRSTDVPKDSTGGIRGLRRLSSRAAFGRKKHADEPTETPAASPSTHTQSRGNSKSGGWTSFMAPSISSGSISSPALHLASDPNTKDTPETQISPVTQLGALISPPRVRRPTASSKDGPPSPPSKKLSASTSSSRPAPSPPTLALTSSTKLPPSPSTPTLPSYPHASSSTVQTPPRGHTRFSAERERLSPPSRARPQIAKGDSERSVSRSESASGSGSRSPSPTTRRFPSPQLVPSPPPRRSSDRRPSFEQRPKPSAFGSVSASHLPLGASPPAIPSQSILRRTSRERHVPPPILTGTPPPSSLYQRRNSSSASFASSAGTRPASPPSTGRGASPVYRTHGRHPSTSSLLGSAILSPQREAMRHAASFIVKEMAKPPPAIFKSITTSPYGGLAGAPAGVKIDPWEEVDRRLAPLARLERIWGKSGVPNGSAIGSHGNASSVTVNGAGTGAMTISGGGEERERRIFSEALRDGYVLAQLMNRLSPTTPLPIRLVDPREDGFVKTSNIMKFRDAAKEFITRTSPDGKELAKEMFGKDDLAEGSVEGVTRVARVLAILASLKGDVATQRWMAKDRLKDGTLRRSAEGDRDFMSGSGPILSRAPSTPSKSRVSSPSAAIGRMTPDPSSDVPAASGHLDRRLSSDRPRRAGPPPTTPPPPPPTRVVPVERRSSGSQNQLLPAPPSPPPAPPPAPPRSSLRAAPSFPSNRVSVASSAQTQSTDATGLFENRLSNRFGTMRTMNTIFTDATSILHDGSWGREEANNVATALGLPESLESPPGNVRRKSYDLKSTPSGLGLALQNHASSDYLQDPSIGGRPGRRDRRSSELAVDLTRVLEESTDMEGSIKPTRRSSDGKPGSARPTNGFNLGKAKWPDDFIGLFGPPSQSPSPPSTRGSRSGRSFLPEQMASSPDEVEPLQGSAKVDVTPKARAPHGATSPIPISSPHRNPSQAENGTDVPFRRPTHRAGSQSVDVLLKPTDRRPSTDRFQLHRSEMHDRGSSSGSDSQQLDHPIPRPLRRSSTRTQSTARHGMYVPKRLSGGDDLSSSTTTLPAVSSVPAVSHIRVPFPRTSSGELATLANEGRAVRTPLPPPGEMTSGPPLPPKDPARPAIRPRHQSDMQTPRMGRRGSAGVPPHVERRGSAGFDDRGFHRKSRLDSLRDGDALASSTNLTRASSMTSGGGSGIHKTLIVQEEGKTPIHIQLGNCIGKGQFGAVFRALNVSTGQIMAVKRINLEGRSETEVAQLMKEVELLKKLDHPSIVKYEGMVRDDDTLSIVLELAESGSLGQMLKSFGKLNETLVATYVTKILEGLHYLHQQQVVHCDLKAANILSTKNGNIKLSDFGVSLTLNAVENKSENVAGTPNWMAPEVIELKGASTSSDIWSLGCTVVELLTGHPPYSDIPNTLSVMFRIVEDEHPPIPEGCSDLLRDFLSQCFNKDPATRPSAEQLFEHPWLKQTWGLNKDLQPENSVPFLRRLSMDFQAKQQISIQNIAQIAKEVAQPPSPAPPVSPPASEEPEFIVKPHSFVKTTFSKPVTCRVCHQHVKKSAVLCEECSLICHAACVKDATPHCDVRAQLLTYAQYANQPNGSPRVSASGPLPSPAIPPSPLANEPLLSSSPSFHNKIFGWKRTSKTSTPDPGSSNAHLPEGDDVKNTARKCSWWEPTLVKYEEWSYPPEPREHVSRPRRDRGSYAEAISRNRWSCPTFTNFATASLANTCFARLCVSTAGFETVGRYTS
ncbi:hypothetical protein FRB99_004926 [Tulasnella sp. 403]|nr:hypothetical protein FRB99_004926 [Tulasnella sp. 403]